MVTQNVLKGFLDAGISVFKVSFQKSQTKVITVGRGEQWKVMPAIGNHLILKVNISISGFNFDN